MIAKIRAAVSEYRIGELHVAQNMAMAQFNVGDLHGYRMWLHVQRAAVMPTQLRNSGCSRLASLTALPARSEGPGHIGETATNALAKSREAAAARTAQRPSAPPLNR